MLDSDQNEINILSHVDNEYNEGVIESGHACSLPSFRSKVICSPENAIRALTYVSDFDSYK